MSRTSANTLYYYDHAVTDKMMDKYGFSRMDALRAFPEK